MATLVGATLTLRQCLFKQTQYSIPDHLPTDCNALLEVKAVRVVPLGVTSIHLLGAVVKSCFHFLVSTAVLVYLVSEQLPYVWVAPFYSSSNTLWHVTFLCVSVVTWLINICSSRAREYFVLCLLDSYF